MLKKRFTSLLLVISMLMGLSTQAFAAESSSSEPVDELARLQDANGDRLEFRMEESADGTYMLYYYVNGVCQTEYHIEDSQYITATTADGEEYIVDSSEYVSTSNIETYDSAVERLDPGFCTIHYKYSSTLGDEVNVSIRQSTVVTQESHTVHAYMNSPAADVVASIVGILVAFFPFQAAAAATSKLAEAILSSMLSIIGGGIVNGLISCALNDSFNCVISRVSFSIIAVCNNISKSASFTNAGTEENVYYSADDTWEYYIDGYTPASIQRGKESSFAQAVWNKCYVAPYPGYKSYTYITGMSL